VLGLENQGFEDKEIDSALNEIAGFAHRKIIYNRSCR
jgi:hypothetical protein